MEKSSKILFCDPQTYSLHLKYELPQSLKESVPTYKNSDKRSHYYKGQRNLGYTGSERNISASCLYWYVNISIDK